MSRGKAKRFEAYKRQKEVELLRGGQAYFKRLLRLIDNAKESIHVQTYIFSDDDTGNLVVEALKKAAGRNVQVFIMADGYASGSLTRAFINNLKIAGIQFRFFNPLFKSRYFYFGRRLHHKMAVVDMRYALVGGINIADRYNDMPGIPAWLDFAVYLEGEAARELCVLCWKTWNGYPRFMGLTPCERKQPAPADLPVNACEVAIRRNDWVRRKNEISSSYVNMFRNARSHITVLCSYFLPGRVIRQQISDAAKRGVKITVITAGESDIWIAKLAERHFYNWMLRQGITIYEYRPTVLHGKIAVCDNKWVTVGSYNINNLSTYASIELNVNVRNESFAMAAERVISEIISKDCIPITRKYQVQTTNVFKKLVRWVSYGFIHAGVYLSTFYYRHKA